MKYERKVNLNIKSCCDISELEDNMRNCSECKKLLETKKVGPNTRRCQKVAEQLVESPKLSRASSYTSNILLERLAERDWCTWFPILTPEFSLPSHWVPRSRSLTSAKGRTIRKLMGEQGICNLVPRVFPLKPGDEVEGIWSRQKIPATRKFPSPP